MSQSNDRQTPIQGQRHGRTDVKSQPRLITAAELSRWLGIRRQQVYQLVDDGILPCAPLGRLLRFDPVAIEEFIRGGGARFAHGWRKQVRS